MSDESILQGTPPAQEHTRGYPITVEVDYQESLSRLSTAFRIILLIPLLIFVAVIAGGVTADFATEGAYFSLGTLGSLVVAHWMVILVRQRPATWLFETIVHIQRFALRASAYFFLLVDKYPPFEGDWGVRYEVQQPETLSRWRLLFWKLLTAIPHIIILIVLWFVLIVIVVISWFAILFTGNFPKGLHNFVVGFMRWEARVAAYIASLTDEYPPFSLDP
jgi:hypothetical protein